MHINIDVILVIVIVMAVCIFVKTGSFGKVIGFLLRYFFFPGLGGILGFLLGTAVGHPFIGLFAGIIIGLVLVFKDGARKMR